MIGKNKRNMLISSILILLPAAVGLCLWDVLPPVMATHWGANGAADQTSSKLAAIVALPLILLAFHWLCILMTRKDRSNKHQNPKVFGMVLWIVPFVSLFANGIMYAAAFGSKINVLSLAFGLLGLMFIFIGNYLPKCKQNRTIGIRIKWTLESEENWYATHRMCGKLWTLGGAVCLFCILLPAKAATYAFSILVTLMVLIPFLYSYLYSRSHKQTSVKNAVVMTPKEKRIALIGSLVGILILLGCTALCFTGNIEPSAEEFALIVKADYWKDLTVEYSAIDHIELRQDGVPGTRVFGFGTPRLLMGSFQNEEFGTYTRYTYTKTNACIVLTVEDQILVVGCIDNASTEALYENILKRIN